MLRVKTQDCCQAVTNGNTSARKLICHFQEIVALKLSRAPGNDLIPAKRLRGRVKFIIEAKLIALANLPYRRFVATGNLIMNHQTTDWDSWKWII